MDDVMCCAGQHHQIHNANTDIRSTSEWFKSTNKAYTSG